MTHGAYSFVSTSCSSIGHASNGSLYDSEFILRQYDIQVFIFLTRKMYNIALIMDEGTKYLGK